MFIIEFSTEKRGNSKEHWTGELLIGPADQLSTNISMHDVVTYMYVNLLVVQYPLYVLALHFFVGCFSRVRQY